jgi:hypothetical protein
MGRARGGGRRSDHRRHQEWRCGSVHASPNRHLALADTNPPAEKPDPAAPAESPGETAELLDDFLIALLDLPGDAWSDIAVALSDELYDRIDRYLEALLSKRRALRA